jgi:hypothetical protein
VRRRDVRRVQSWPDDLTGAALAFVIEVGIVIGLGAVALAIAAIVIAST